MSAFEKEVEKAWKEWSSSMGYDQGEYSTAKLAFQYGYAQGAGKAVKKMIEQVQKFGTEVRSKV